ncbi:MAG: MDR family MFS transporter [Phycisphaerae bacterium]
MLSAYTKLPFAIYLLCLGMLVNRAGTMVIIFLTRYLNQELGFSESAASTSLGLFGAGSLAAALLGGFLADHIGRKPVMLIALVGGAIVLVVFSYLTTTTAIYVAIFMFALTAEMYRPAAQAMISDLVPPIDRPKAFGLMFFCINLGFSVAPILGGFLAKHSYRFLFEVDALTATLFAMVILIGIRDTHPGMLDTADNAATDQPVAQESTQDKDADVGNWETLRHVARDRTFQVYFLAVFLCMLVYLQHISTLSVFLKKQGIDDDSYGRLIALNGIMIVALQLPITLLVEKMRRYQVMMIGAILIGLGYMVNLLGTTMPLAAVGVATWTLGELMHAPLMMTIVGDLAPPAMRGRYMGIMGTSFASAMMLGAPAGGLILAKWGAPSLWYACMGSGLLAALCFWWIRHAMHDVDDRKPQCENDVNDIASLASAPE